MNEEIICRPDTRRRHANKSTVWSNFTLLVKVIIKILVAVLIWMILTASFLVL